MHLNMALYNTTQYTTLKYSPMTDASTASVTLFRLWAALSGQTNGVTMSSPVWATNDTKMKVRGYTREVTA
jgi:hypothetical protein